MVKRLWIINKDEWKKITRIQTTISELQRLFKDLKSERFDCVIDLQGLFRSGLIAKTTGAPVRIGFKEAKEGSTVFYTDKVEGGKDIHAVDRYLKIAAYLGCNKDDVHFPFPPSSTSLSSVIPSIDVRCGGYAVMAPGARKPANRWPAQRFGRLASRLPVKTLVIGSRGDTKLADEVVRTSKGMAISIAGRTDIRGLIEVIRCSRFMVSNDTGPMHVAAALGISVFAIFGPANPIRTGPYGANHTIIRRDIPCSPCYRRTCKDPKCMDLIKVEEVAGIINEFLSFTSQPV